MQFDVVHFFEKKGCTTNAKQKKLLSSWGVVLKEEDLLRYPFSKKTLKMFLEKAPINAWFNPNAPDIKSKKIDTSKLDDEEAIALLLKNPILIKRPLMIFKGRYILGFDEQAIAKLLGKKVAPLPEHFSACSVK